MVRTGWHAVHVFSIFRSSKENFVFPVDLGYLFESESQHSKRFVIHVLECHNIDWQSNAQSQEK